MCWSCNSNRLVLKANRDIKVNKIVLLVSSADKDTVFSYFERYPYKIGELYYDSFFPFYEGQIINEDKEVTNCAYHSYGDNMKMFKTSDNVVNMMDLESGIVYTTYTCDLRQRPIKYTTALVECIIPIGSLYSENEIGEYISNQIIIKKIKKKYHPRKGKKTFFNHISDMIKIGIMWIKFYYY